MNETNTEWEDQIPPMTQEMVEDVDREQGYLDGLRFAEGSGRDEETKWFVADEVRRERTLRDAGARADVIVHGTIRDALYTHSAMKFFVAGWESDMAKSLRPYGWEAYWEGFESGVLRIWRRIKRAY